MAKIDYTIRSREIVDLVNSLNSGNLILKAYFQRNLVWREIHRKDFVKTILEGLPFPQIFLARGGIDVDTLSSFSCVVDGQQRLTAIRDFVAGQFDVDGKKFSDLAAVDRTAFLKYEVAVIDFDLEPDDPLLNEIFQRLNRTYYSLSAVEKLSAEYSPSELMIFCKTLIGEFSEIAQNDADGDLEEQNGNPFVNDPNLPEEAVNWAIHNGNNDFSDLIQSERIFSANDLSRKVPLMIVLNIICSSYNGYYNRNTNVKRFLDQFREELPEKNDLFSYLQRISICLFGKLNDDSLWLNKANFFSVCVELLRRRDEKIDLDIFREELERIEAAGLTDDYLLAAREGVNNTKERQLRGNFLSSVIQNL